MSSNPTQPKFGDQGEGVNFPPEDDAEGHRFAAAGEGDGQPDGFRAALGEGDGRPEGFRALADSEDDTEGHHRMVMADGDDDTEGHASSFVDGRPGGQPEAMEPVPSKEGFAARADGEDDTEGHRFAAAADGDDQGKDGFAAL